MNERIKYIMQGLEVNEIQASMISELISDIPQHQLKNFLVFRMNYIEPMMSKELITKNALFDYRRIQIEARIKAGERVFGTMESMIKFIETYYKGKNLGYGLATYYDFVIIAVDKDCNLVNKYATNEFGTFLKLDNDEKSKVYEFLFENQNRIGDVKYISSQKIMEHKENMKQMQLAREKRELEKEEEQKRGTIDDKVLNMLSSLRTDIARRS